MNTNNPLLTDLYQLTMVAAYHASGRAEQEAAFHLFFRTLPFKGGYAIAAGLGSAVEWLENFRFAADDIVYLATLRDSEKAPLLQPAFLDYLLNLKLPVSIDAIPEGTLVFPHQPLLRITGPILQCQLLETALLDIINFQTLSATKAARVCQAAQGEPVLEMGLRRGQGADGAVSASRAAHIGGCATTSNVLAGKTFGIPVKGTHAHSWVMSFESELEAFEQYAAALPGNCIFLVGTYDTLEGVRNAVKMGIKLRESGHRLLGIRLDSGDRAWLSQQARIILDEGGFPDAAIVASNDLDVNLIESLKHQGAKINVWASAPNSSPAATKPRSAVSINSPPSATLRETGSRASNSASRSSKFPRPVSNRSAGSRRTGNSSRTPLTMLSWIALNHATMDGYCFDVGNTVTRALMDFQITRNPYSGPSDKYDAGNGSIMRLAPIPMRYADEPGQAVYFSGESSRTTHQAVTCIDACRYLGGILAALLNGQSKEAVLSPLFHPTNTAWDENELCSEIAQVASGSFKRKQPPSICGSGYVVQSLEAALWAFHHSTAFRDGALLAVNLGNDADTTGAIYGQLAGACYGIEGIPADWRSKISHFDLIVDFATQLHNQALQPQSQ